MQKPKFDLRQVRDDQLARLRNQARRFGTLRRLRGQATQVGTTQEPTSLSRRLAEMSWREYLVPGVALLILFVALFLSKVTSPVNNASVDVAPTDFGEVAEVPTIIGNADETPTIIGDTLYPSPLEEVTAGTLGPTPVPTGSVLTDTGELGFPYPGPDNLDEPFPFGTAPSIEGLPTPPVAGGDDLFPTPWDSGGIPPIDSGGFYPPPVDNGSFEQPPVGNGGVTQPPIPPMDNGGFEQPPTNSGVTQPPANSGGVTPPPPVDIPTFPGNGGSLPTDESSYPFPEDNTDQPDPGSSLPPPVFPTTPPSVPAQPPAAAVAPPRQNTPVTVAPPRQNTPAAVAPPRQNTPARATTIPAPVPEDPLEELPLEGAPEAYPAPRGDVPAQAPPIPPAATPTTRRVPTVNAPAPTSRPVNPTATSPGTSSGGGALPGGGAPPAGQPTQAPAPTATLAPTEAPPTATPVPPTATPVLPTSTPAPPPTTTPMPVNRIEGETRWSIDQSPIIVERDLVIAPGASLQIDPGVEIRFKPDTNFYVEGRLATSGTPGNPVRFTGPEGRWGAIIGQPGSTISLAHAEIRNAGRGGVAINSAAGQLTLHDSQIVDGGGGVVASGSAVDIRRSQVTGNDLAGGSAVNITLGAQAPTTLQGNIFGGNLVPGGTPQVRLIAGTDGNGPLEITGNAFSAAGGPLLDLQTASAIGGTIRCNAFRGGSVGLQLSSSTPSAAGFTLVADNNAFEGQAVAGAASTIAFDIPNNWWGDPSGPTDAVRNPEGRGVRAGVNVGFNPWLQSRPECAPVP